MPALSPTMTTGTIVKWHKHEGDALNPGDLVAEVATDKATVDFECQDSGYLAQILVPGGTTDVPVGRIIAIMVDSKETVDAFKGVAADTLTAGTHTKAAPSPAPAAAAPAPAPATAPSAPPKPTIGPSTPSAGRVVASPLAKRVGTKAFLRKYRAVVFTLHCRLHRKAGSLSQHLQQ
jgi:pyruvate dehydrogenase E2 component (dihydrolipoamide acetyltransferase)